MSTTSASLLERLRHDPHSPDWQQLVEIYTPLIRSWLRRHEVFSADSDDLVQEVMAVVVRRLREFEHNQRTGAFRNWLRTITINCLRDHWRARHRRPATGDSDFQNLLAELEDPDSSLSQVWNQEHDRHVTRQLLGLLRPHFEQRTWEAFQRVALDGQDARQVAAELGLTTNAVFIAKSRVLSRLREEAAGLLEE
jgi:RNA polymerase sigma-70 factor (ECF subfamily)